MSDIYQQITDRIIAELEKGKIPWHCRGVRLSGATATLSAKSRIGESTQSCSA